MIVDNKEFRDRLRKGLEAQSDRSRSVKAGVFHGDQSIPRLERLENAAKISAQVPETD